MLASISPDLTGNASTPARDNTKIATVHNTSATGIPMALVSIYSCKAFVLYIRTVMLNDYRFFYRHLL